MQGLWTIEFGSSTGRFGAGVVVFKEGRVMGGDSGYYYIGTYSLVGDEFSAKIDLVPFVPGIETVFNTLGHNVKLSLTGTLIDSEHATAQGSPVAMPHLKLGVKLTKRN